MLVHAAQHGAVRFAGRLHIGIESAAAWLQWAEITRRGIGP
jgi:hypothetical protein